MTGEGGDDSKEDDTDDNDNDDDIDEVDDGAYDRAGEDSPSPGGRSSSSTIQTVGFGIPDRFV